MSYGRQMNVSYGRQIESRRTKLMSPATAA
jgi:hypothetical protein